jgi:endonuclease/exonuclease/phosphatase family metal-dependent hydrolase
MKKMKTDIICYTTSWRCGIFILLLVLTFSLVISSCTEDESIIIGTFNIAWLGDGLEDKIDRDDKDYRKIANVIVNSGADIMAVQEIENEAALEKLMEFLPDYEFKLGESGYIQNVGFIYSSDVVCREVGNYEPLAVVENRTRPGFICEFEKNNIKMLMMSVHFKSTSRYDSTFEMKKRSWEIRRQQSEVLVKWADSVDNNYENVVIAGDLNDNPTKNKHNLKSLSEFGEFEFLTKNLRSCKYPQLTSIDHIVVSDDLMEYIDTSSVHAYNIFKAFTKDEIKTVSDHCPVLVKIKYK